MTGPCTLLAQPQFGRYFDAAGAHALAWVGGSSLASYQTTVQSGGFRDNTKPPVALSSAVIFDGEWRNFVGPSAPSSYIDPLTTLAVANGTKTLIGGTYAISTLVGAGGKGFLVNFNAAMNYWFAYSYGLALLAQLTATAANLSATRATLAGVPDSGTVYAVVINGAAATRTFQCIQAGADIGPAFPIPAKTIALIAANASGLVAGQQVGFRVPNSANGEQFGAIWIGCNADSNNARVVPFNAAAISTTLEQSATSGEGPVTPWAGTAKQSAAEEGEQYWRIPVTRAHFPSERQGAIVARWLPVGWPSFPKAAAFAVGRMGASASNGGYGYSDVSISYWPRDSATIAELDVTWLPNQPDTHPVGDYAGYTNIDVALPASPWQQMMVSALAWDGSAVTARHAGASVWTSTRTNWQGEDFPFFGIEPTTSGPDTVYLFPGLPADYYLKTATLHRDVAVFSRPLTSAEYAYLEDDSAVWSFNMFATPTRATVTGLDAPIYRGDDCAVTIAITDADGDAVPLYGCTVWLTAKAIADLADPDDASAEFSCSVAFGRDGTPTGSGYLEGDPAAGQVTFGFSVPFVANNPVQPSGAIRYSVTTLMQWDVQVKDLDGTVRTLATGQVAIASDVTRREVAP